MTATKTFIQYIDLYDDRDVIDPESKEVVGTEQYLVKKNIKVKCNVMLSDIKRFQQVIGETGRIQSNRTSLVLSDGTSLIVSETFDNMYNLLNNKKIGFEYGNK